MCNEQNLSYNIETLMKDYGNDVLRTAYLYVKDYHLAEDVFQDVFLKINQKLNSFHGESSIKTWIIRITINTCKDYLKSAYNRHVVPLMDEEGILSEEAVSDSVERKEQNLLVREVMMKQPDKYKDILICIYFHEMTVAEVSKTLNIAEGTVKTRLVKARNRMKSALEGRI